MTDTTPRPDFVKLECVVDCEQCGHERTLRQMFRDKQPVRFQCASCGEYCIITYLKGGWKQHPNPGLQVMTPRLPAVAG